MKYLLITLFALTICFTSCNPFPGPRNVDWKKAWEKNQTKLKVLAQDIIAKGDKKYTIGINNFPVGFDYPFDDGFAFRRPYGNNETVNNDIKNITITFYVDRGLLDHYSAIIFTNDPADISEFDRKIKNGGKDFKIEPNWYMIND